MMRRRDFLKALGLGGAAMAIAPGHMLAEDAPDKPNVLFLFADALERDVPDRKS